MSKVRAINRLTSCRSSAASRTPEETAEPAGLSLDDARCIIKMTRQPLSLDQPVGDHEDSYFGEFLEDHRDDDPLYDTQPAKRSSSGIDEVMHEPELPRARNPPPALRPGRRLRLHAGRSRQDLLRHPRTRPPDRNQSRPQAAAALPRPLAGQLHRRPRNSARRDVDRRVKRRSA